MAFTLWQCAKEDQIWVETDTIVLGDTEDVSFLIQVIDETGAPLSGATLTHNLSGQTWPSDERGLVLLEGLSLPSGGLPITVEMPGKMKMVKLLRGRDGSQTSMKLQLYPYDAETTIQTGATGSLDDGGQLTLPAQLARANGNPYTGEVRVLSHYYNPAESDFLEAAPGNMSAIGADGNAYSLESYGMYAVELLDAAGNELRIPEGQTATLQFPLPANYSSVPGEVPLWSMDESTGKWMEEGAAVLNNGYLEAQVAHFSWWNVDVPFNPVTVCMRLVNEAGQPLSGFAYRISTPDQQIFYNSGWTDVEGNLCAVVPADAAVALSVVWEDELLPPADLGGFVEDADLGDVTIDLGDYVQLTGLAVDCEGAPLQNVLVTHTLDGNTGYTLTNATGAFQLLRTGEGTMEVQLYSYQSGVQSEPQSVALTSAQSLYELGAIPLCEDFSGGSVYIDADITEHTTWTADNTYILDGRIIVRQGATLTIEPGTVIKGNLGEGPSATVLVIARGGKLVAEGTPQLPIVFTSVADELTPADVAAGNFQSPNLSPDEQALWGGLIVLGRAPISASDGAGNDQTEVVVESLAIDLDADLHAYGGNDPLDDSGLLRYLSIRHGGVNIGLGNEINGLTLAGVGSGTTIENIEVVGCKDDGVALFGGTVNIQDLVVWNAEDDAFDTDQGWAGTLDNFVLYTPGSSALELDGPEGSLLAKHTIQNGTVVMNDGARTTARFLINLDLDTDCALRNIHYLGPFEAGQTVTNNEVNPETTFENITFDIDPAAFSTLFDPEAPIPNGCSAGGSPQADVSGFNWTWTAQAGKLDGL